MTVIIQLDHCASWEVLFLQIFFGALALCSAGGKTKKKKKKAQLAFISEGGTVKVA